MKFDDFVVKGQARKVSKDMALAKSLLKMADQDTGYLKGLVVNEISARKLVSNYYDVLRSILEAIAILDGYKVYSHEAFTYFLKYKGEPILAEKFDRFRKIRNGINYYGKDIGVEEAKENIKDIVRLIFELRAKYLKS